MVISHELPLHLLNYSTTFNDYEYCLPRFWFKYPEYKQYYINAKQNGRFMILDNGLFEGDSFSDKELLEIIHELKPDIFITPDAWNDWSTTTRKALQWRRYELPDNTQLMVVLQGTSAHYLKNMLTTLKEEGFRYFAFNHSSAAYDIGFPNKLHNQCFGRIKVVSNMKNEGLLDDCYIHLLGASLPQEFTYYPKEWSFIKSVDTSSPIINGILGIKYEEWGLMTKPTQKLEEFMEMDNLDNYDVISIVEENVKRFRKFVGESPKNK